MGIWKIRREIARIGRQIRSLRGLIFATVMRPLWHRLRDRMIDVHDGAILPGPRHAIVVVFQPKGCPDSLFDTLAHLLDKGFTPLVVCNGQISASDEKRLRALCWRLLKRPNLGYDFGGYADGIAYLRKTGVEVDALMIMNDTLWWPAVPDAQCLDALVACDSDYAGLCNFPFRPGRKRHTALTGRNYVSSFCFLVSKRVWQSQAFADYWAHLPLHGYKPTVIERGEVGFCRAMENAGFTPTVLVDHARLVEEVDAMDDARAEAFIARLPVLGGHVRPRVDTMVARLADGTAAPGAARDLLRDIMPTLNPWDALAINGLVDGRIDFIKKANLKTAPNAARFLSMAQAAGLPLNATTRDELARFAGRGGAP